MQDTRGGGCQHCGDPSILPAWREAFNVSVCAACSRRHEQLLSKSNAKTLYLLSDADMHQLGYLEKPNPHNAKFTAMKQYLVRQVEALAVTKHGSLAAVEEQRQQRMRGKLDKRLQKRQAAEGQQQREQEEEARLQAAIDKYTQQQQQQQQQQGRSEGHGAPPREAAAAAAAEPEDVLEPRTGKRLRRFGRDMAAVEVEEI